MYKLKSGALDFDSLRTAYPFTKSDLIMPAKKNLEVVTLPTQGNEDLGDRLNQSIETGETRTLEEIVADELLDSINWTSVQQALLKRVQQKFIKWFTSGGSASMIATNEIEAEALAIESGEEAA